MIMVLAQILVQQAIDVYGKLFVVGI